MQFLILTETLEQAMNRKHTRFIPPLSKSLITEKVARFIANREEPIPFPEPKTKDSCDNTVPNARTTQEILDAQANQEKKGTILFKKITPRAYQEACSDHLPANNTAVEKACQIAPQIINTFSPEQQSKSTSDCWDRLMQDAAYLN